jgi:ABC-type transport system involved in multi-copper enzyme maturation permease subunit
MMPTTALIRHELRTLAASWLVRLWLAASVLLTLLVTAVSWAPLPTSHAIAMLLFPFLVFPWFLVVIVLGVSPVTGTRAEAVADGILSRPVARYEYMLASWIARVSVVLGVCFVSAVPAIVILASAKREAATDTITVYGVLASLFLVALVQTFLVSVAFFMGTMLRRPILAIVVLLFVWFPFNSILNMFALEEFSTISLDQAIPTLLRQSWRTPADDDEEAEVLDENLQSLERQREAFMSIMTGVKPRKPKRESGEYFQRDESGVFADFSLLRVTLGYGLPALAAIGLATLLFCRRDL